MKSNHSGIISSDLWFKDDEFRSEIMGNNVVEESVKCEFLDIPGVYHYLDDEFSEVFDALANTSKFEIFNLKAI